VSIFTMTEEEKKEDTPAEEELSFDAVDLMLDGNLQGQINYSLVKAIASALDEKAQILIKAEESYQPVEDETFPEVAMPEIEAMYKAILEGCVDFSKIRFWEACETAEVAWEETKDEEGKVVQRLPYGNSLEEPRPGNRILANLEQILIWMEAVHVAHEKNGMGWVSPYGCPEDGQQAFEARAKSIKEFEELIITIQKKFDF
jgi:hypothetical protein